MVLHPEAGPASVAGTAIPGAQQPGNARSLRGNHPGVISHMAYWEILYGNFHGAFWENHPFLWWVFQHAMFDYRRLGLNSSM